MHQKTFNIYRERIGGLVVKLAVVKDYAIRVNKFNEAGIRGAYRRVVATWLAVPRAKNQ
jgi:hypothetical protein